MKAFLDANILFSAANAESPTARAIQLLLNNAKAATCSYAIEETQRNLERKRPLWLPDFKKLATRIEIVPTHYFALSVKLAEKDLPILCSAIRAQCTHLVTSDQRDFAHLYNKTIHAVTVISLLRLTQLLTSTKQDGQNKNLIIAFEQRNKT